MTTTQLPVQLHVRHGENPDGTYWADAYRGQRKVAGTWRAVAVGRPDRGQRGYVTPREAESAALRSWWDTADRLGWV